MNLLKIFNLQSHPSKRVVVVLLEDLEIRGQEETIQTTAFLRLARILRRVLETWGDSSGKPLANTGVKNSQMSKIIKEIIIMIIIIIIIIKCSKLVQKEYKTRHNWVGKVIH